MNQKYFLLETLLQKKAEKEAVKCFGWIKGAFDRRVKVEVPGLTTAGSIFGQSVVIPTKAFHLAFSLKELLKLDHQALLIKQFYPEQVTTPVRSEILYSDHIQLALVMPEQQVKISPLEEGVWPQAGDSVILVSSLLGIVALKMVCCMMEPYPRLAERLNLMHIDANSGVPASFIYDLVGRVVAIAITTTTENLVMALPLYELSCLYDNLRSAFRNLDLSKTKPCRYL